MASSNGLFTPRGLNSLLREIDPLDECVDGCNEFFSVIGVSSAKITITQSSLSLHSIHLSQIGVSSIWSSVLRIELTKLKVEVYLRLRKHPPRIMHLNPAGSRPVAYQLTRSCIPPLPSWSHAHSEDFPRKVASRPRTQEDVQRRERRAGSNPYVKIS